MTNPLFAITNGTLRVSFFGKGSGIHIIDWSPSAAADKDGGIWQQSAVTDGRELIIRPRENIVDTLTLTFNEHNIDAVARDTQAIRRLLELAQLYWTTKWQKVPVWIEARGDCETNTRYALVYGYTTPNDDNPFEPSLGGYGMLHGMESFPLIIEHGFWKPYPPGQSECLPISADDCWCQPSYLIFNGTSSIVNCGSDATLDNLHWGAFTAETWFRIQTNPTTTHCMIAKNDGWYLATSLVGGNIYIRAANVSGGNSLIRINNIPLNVWAHVALTFDWNSDRYLNLYYNGVQGPYTSRDLIAAVGNDSASSLCLGTYRPGGPFWYPGYLGWTRISNFVRYTNNFIPPARCKIPEPDANTLAIWIREGTGTAIDNYQGLAACDGVAANCTWGCDCDCEEDRY